MKVHEQAGERIVPLTRATNPDWCLDPLNLSELIRWLDEKGRLTSWTASDYALFCEKPWHWSPEWIEMWKERGEL